MIPKQQRTAAVSGPNTRSYDDFPSIPDQLVKAFPYLAEYQKAQRAWWERTKWNLANLESNHETLRLKVNELSSASASSTTT